jgi:hypothetical protein
MRDEKRRSGEGQSTVGFFTAEMADCHRLYPHMVFAEVSTGAENDLQHKS